MDLEVGLGIELSPVLVPCLLQSGSEVAEAVQFFLDNVDELGEVLPLHLLALAVEVEPDVVEILVLELSVNLGELISNSLL